MFIHRPVTGRLIDSILTQDLSRVGDWGGSNLDANSLQSGSVLDAIQQLRHGGNRVGSGCGARNTKQALRFVQYEPAEPQKTAADQVDSSQAHGQTKVLLGQLGGRT